MKYKLLRYWLLLLIMITGGSVALQATDYVPVTSTSQLQAGKKYLFVGKYKTNKMENPRWATVKDYNSGSKYFNSFDITATEADNTVGVKFTDPADAMTFTLGGEDGAWTFLGSDGMYMSLTNTSNQVHQAAAVESDNQKWTVAFEEGAVASIKNKALTTRILWSNISSSRFACYGNKQSSNTMYLFVEAGGETTSTFRDIKADLTQLQALATGSNVYIKVSETGEISQAASAEEANATLKGNWHSSNYGWSNFTASVPVQGCAKITYATHDYGNDIVVTNTAGDEVAKFSTKGPKWENDKVNNVVVAYYRTNEATTLNFSNANYNPYFAVEAIDPGDLPAEVTKYNVTFAAGEGTGTAPKALEIEAGQKFNAPKNYFLYKEGSTLTGWNDGTKTYAVGEEITPEADMTLTAQFTANTVALADRTAPVTISYDLSGYNDVGTYNYQGNSGIIVTQATVNGQSIDVKADVDATSGKFAYNGSGWHQVNNGTKVTVPSCKGAQFEVATYSKPEAVYFNGSAEGVVTTEGGSATYTATGEAASIEISQNDNDYWQLISINLPVTGGGGGGEEPQPHDPVTLTWDYTEAAPSANPDNGLYYASSVNDAAGTNNGLKGIKLNSSGWAYFEKPAVAGTLTLTFGDRKKADAYEVNVSKGTLNEDGKTATKGDLIGSIGVTESPGKASIELGADVTGIYIDRKTGSEGVLCKVVFKEFVPRDFTDFELTNAQMSGAESFDPSTLPSGVIFTGTARNDSHGYGNVTLVVPVDGTVKFTIGGCQYANSHPNCKVTNTAGDVLATPLLKTTNCYHQTDKEFNTRAVTYFYVGGPTTLTFSDIDYLPYFKAEATEVHEAVITYKDQNGNKLGTKTVYEGDPVGEIPYTEADLTIPSGEKFRGWVYASKIKVKATDIVNGDLSINASVTPIELDPETGSIQTYDLTQATFYPEDHENFSVTNGAYYNNHGFTFEAGGSFSVNVSAKAQIVLNLCQYGDGTTITVTDPDGNVVRNDVPAKTAADGGTTAINYEGKAGVLTFTFATQAYLHKVTVFNVSNFIEKDEASGYYIVPANDGAGLVLALNSAAAEEGSKIFLQNGTYDFGEATLTGISGKNVSLIGQSMEKVIIKNAPPISKEGLGSADLFINTGEGLYIQDLTLQNALDYYAAGSAGRAVTLHDKGTKTINKNVRHLSYQDTYYSNKVGGLYYFEGGEMHGTVDYLCGDGRAFFEGMKIINEKRSSATISANSELYVFNNCVVENNADKYTFGRAWSNNPVCIFLNTKLMDPSKLESTRWNLSGINCDYSIAGEYGTTDADGNNITPATNVVTFKKASTTLETILTAEQAATYTMQYVLGDWAATAKQEAIQLEAPIAEFKDGVVTITPADNGAIAYLIEKNGEFAGITTAFTFPITIDAEKDALTIRAANSRGGFGPAKHVAGTTGIEKVAADSGERGEQVIYNLAGQRVNKASKGLYIINGKKVAIK